MPHDHLISQANPDDPTGRLKFDRRTMIVCAGCAALGALAPTRAAAAPTARRRTAAETQTSQSPIDFRPDEITFVESLPAIAFAYPRMVDVTLVNTGSPDEEKTVRADVPDGAAHIDISGERWELDQFHWHTPSEHEVEGHRTAMEMHLVHHRDDGTAEDGPFLVLGVLMKRGPENSALEPIFESFHLVDEEGETLDVAGVRLRTLLPGGLETFRYSGSLTTPPFTEPVSWVVFAKRITVSPDQVANFEALFPEGNSREVQPLNDREVLSDAEGFFE